MHRVGGLEKEDGTGNVSYDAENHDAMTRIRAAKIAGIANDIPPVDLDDEDGAEFLVLSWGGTWGAAKRGGRAACAAAGHKIAHAHLRHMNPFPADLGDVVRRYPKIFVPEINLGQLSKLIRAEYLVDARSYGKMYGVPFHAADLEAADPGDDGRMSMTEGNGTPVKLARKDFQSDQEVRWCPGCGDYGILTAIQLMLPETGIKPEDLVFVSGIGCAARLPYYMNTYGIHSIHGRAPAVATGVALARPDLHVWVIGGDGDMLSIGGNHLIHALRRNVNMKILMFNNQIYGLTKGQYSPTSEMGKVTKSTPFGSLDHPFNPISVALGAEATFVARTHDMDRKHMTEVFTRANEHRGAAFVEVYQNCNVFNDGAFDTILNKDARPDMLINLRHGEPIRFGADREMGVVMNEFGEAQIVRVDDVGEDRHPRARRDPSRPVARVRAVAAGRAPRDADPGRRVPRGRAAVVRGRDAAPARRRRRAQRPRRPRQAPPLGPDLDRQLARSDLPFRAFGTPSPRAAWG